MKKTFKVVMLPTNEKAPIYLQNNKLFVGRDVFQEAIQRANKNGNESIKLQHLYIISDDEIKELPK